MSSSCFAALDAARGGGRATVIAPVLLILASTLSCSADATDMDDLGRRGGGNDSRSAEDEDAVDELESSAEGPYGVNTSGECRFIEGQIDDGIQGDCGRRCSSETSEQLQTCTAGDLQCEADAFVADDTRAVPIEWTVLIEIQADELNCDVCTLAQNISCQYKLCASEAKALDDCIVLSITEEELNACDELEEELDDCLEDDPGEFEKCKRNREAACFEPPM